MISREMKDRIRGYRVVDSAEVREELRARVNQRFYGHDAPELKEGEREVKVKALYLVLAGFGCPGCDQAEEEYKKEIESGDVVVVSVEDKDEKAMDIVLKLGLYALPALVAEDEEGEYLVMDGGA